MPQVLKSLEQSGPLVLSYMDRSGKIAVERVATGFGGASAQ